MFEVFEKLFQLLYTRGHLLIVTLCHFYSAKHFSGFAGRWLVVPQCSAAVFGQREVAVIADGVVTRRVPLRQLTGNLPARQSKLKQRLPLATPFQCLATFLA